MIVIIAEWVKYTSPRYTLVLNTHIEGYTLLILSISEIDDLYESKRQLISNFKKQSDEYQDGKEKPRRGSWKKREDYRKSATTERRKQP